MHLTGTDLRGPPDMEEREVFVLCEIEECSYAEIAERLEIPQGTVMSRLFHARQHLKDALNRLL